jgi:3-hydroxymyristoyl/3-hydroxydecanoyl-(acyl carrier protein) dehydratase
MAPEEIEAMARAGRKRLLFDPAAAKAVDLGRGDVEKLLPHREPFLFVDRITGLDRAAAAIAGTRRIDPADPLFRGHFPQEPIYPGVLQLEIMGQLALCLLGLLEEEPENRAQRARAYKIHHAVFLAPIRPGDELAVLGKLVETDDYTAICAGQIVKGGAICAFALMEVYFVEA